MNPDPATLIPHEGWHVVHLFYSIDRVQWSMLAPEDQLEAKTELTRLVQEIRGTEKTQLLTFSIVTPKADLGFMLLTPDLHTANEFEKKLTVSLGPGVLQPVFSYLSMTERSEYTTTNEQYAKQLTEEGVKDGTPEYAQKLEEFEKRMTKYLQDRLYPNMADWPVFCFYPMTKRRESGANWYAQDFETRRRLMGGHAVTGRKFHGRVRQLITGSTGLDDWEWGVTLFAKDSFDIKSIVYDMRFDEVSALYAEFGDFYIGVQLPLLAELFRRVCL